MIGCFPDNLQLQNNRVASAAAAIRIFFQISKNLPDGIA